MEYTGLTLHEVNGQFYFVDPVLDRASGSTWISDGKQEGKRREFMTRYGLRKSISRDFPYWGKLVPKEAAKLLRVKYTNRFEPKGEFEVMGNFKVDDHAELFTKNGLYLYSSQPYDLTLDNYKTVEVLWRKHGLFVDISYKDAWHIPGGAPLFVVSQFPIKLSK